MPKMIFVNLPVANLTKSVAFYEALGATRNPQFSNEAAAMMVISDTISVMLLSHERFKDFTTKAIPDPGSTAQVLLCLSMEDRASVERAVEDAVGAGGKADPTPTQDYGFMYGRSYEDPDGHIWEVMWMDMEAATSAMSEDSQHSA